MAAKSSARTGLTAFDDPVPSPADRLAAGRAHRATVPRSSHGLWEPPADRRDPVEVLVESNRSRLPDLVPLRSARMAVSPFTFLRGSAQVMAFDLAAGPSTDLEVRLCGDAHIGNFGAIATPARRPRFRSAAVHTRELRPRPHPRPHRSDRRHRDTPAACCGGSGC